jgi:hypothetical protein
VRSLQDGQQLVLQLPPGAVIDTSDRTLPLPNTTIPVMLSGSVSIHGMVVPPPPPGSNATNNTASTADASADIASLPLLDVGQRSFVSPPMSDAVFINMSRLYLRGTCTLSISVLPAMRFMQRSSAAFFFMGLASFGGQLP